MILWMITTSFECHIPQDLTIALATLTPFPEILRTAFSEAVPAQQFGRTLAVHSNRVGKTHTCSQRWTRVEFLNDLWRSDQMQKRLEVLRAKLTDLHRDDSGQDLIEYALLAALIALAATVGMQTVASDINNAFTKIGSKLSNAVGT